MNAQLKPHAESLPLELIDLDIENDRQSMDPAKLRELAESIKVEGLVQPVTVYEKKGGRYILGCGHRRFAAHKLLKFPLIAAIIRPAATEGQIRAARAIENLQRTDLTPIEESEACEALLDSHAGDAQAAANAIGWEKRRFENRLALARLSPRVKQLLLDGLLTLAHAQLIARIPDQKVQEQIAGNVKGATRKFSGVTSIDQPPMSLSDTRDLVEAQQRDVSKVPWLMDVPFAGRAACDKCPMRSGNCTGLFVTEAEENPNICLDKDCYQEKHELASRRTRMAGHTLAAENLPKNMDGFNKAISIRGKDQDISMIKPTAAFAAAKDAAENGVGKEKPKGKKSGKDMPTTAEKTGEAKRKQDEAAEKLYDQMVEVWHGKCDGVLGAWLSEDPLRVAMLAVLTYHKDFSNLSYRRAKPATFAKLKELVELIKTPSLANLKEMTAAVLRDAPKVRRFGIRKLELDMPPTLAIFTNWDALEREHKAVICEAAELPIEREPQLKDFQKQVAREASEKNAAAQVKAVADKRAQDGDKKKAAKKAAQKDKTKPKKTGKKKSRVYMAPM